MPLYDPTNPKKPLGAAPAGSDFAPGGANAGPPQAAPAHTYSGFAQQNPATVTHPDGTTTTVTPGQEGTKPIWQATMGQGGAGTYSAYLNQLPVGAGQQVTPLGAQTTQGIQAAQNQAGGVNLPLQTAVNDQAGARQQQQGMVPALQMAGAGNAAMQTGTAQALGAASGAASAQQQALALGAKSADAPSAAAQNSLTSILMNGAVGNGPSAAQPMLRSGIDQGIAAQHAMAAGVRGQGAAGAMHGAQQVGGQMQLQGAVQAAQLRAQEQQAAQAQAGQVTAQGRAGDIARYGLGADILQGQRASDTAAAGTIGGIAGQGRGQDIAQQQAVADYISGIRGQDIGAGAALGGVSVGQQQVNNQQQQAALGLGLDAEKLRQLGIQTDTNTALGGGTLMSQTDLGNRRLSLGHAEAGDQLIKDYVGAGLSAAGAVGAAAVGKPG